MANNEAGVFSWSHVSDERCTMLYDKAGHSLVTMEGSDALAQISSAAAFARGHPIKEDWWADMLRGTETLTPSDAATIMCTSAGKITRLIFHLVESKLAPANSPPHGSKTTGNGRDESKQPAGSTLELVSNQHGSIVSSTQSSFHVRVSPAIGLRPSHTIDDGIAGFQLLKTDGIRAATTSLHVNVTVNGVEGTALPGGVSVDGVGEGTNVFKVCLFEDQVGGHRRGRAGICTWMFALPSLC